MRLVLVRHGEPAYDADAPEEDPVLSDLGRRQARATGALLRSLPQADVLVSSTTRRARQTAEELGAALGLEVVVDGGVDEYPQLGRPYVPVEVMRRTGHPDWERISSGDLPAWADAGSFRDGVVAALDQLAERNPGRSTVVVACHAGVINAYLGHILGIPLGMYFPLSYASVSTVIVGRHGRRSIVSVNEHLHVPPA